VTEAGSRLRALLDAGRLDLPLPGHGETRERFAALAALGSFDLAVARLAEAHTDAVAILAELGADPSPPGTLWGVWAAEPPDAVLRAEPGAHGWTVSGRKAWCSGAGILDAALVTAVADDGPRLLAVRLDQPGARPADDRWPAAALADSDTRSVDFEDAVATPVGEPGGYLDRPGFWHGAAGVAAVWHGGAAGVAGALLRAARRRDPDELTLVAWGAVDVALGGSWAALTAAADTFDDDPTDATGRAAAVARRTRGAVEAAATLVVDRVGRALGPAPLAMDGEHARRVADLQLYIRQSHGDRDLLDLGRRLTEVGPDWLGGEA
jgi:alkylation response protein AidB-like acyl-CoA dehydrogenase